jgi:hypothetical protein
MSQGMGIHDASKAIIRGVEIAFEHHFQRAGLWLDHAPEYYVTSKIADQLAKRAGPDSITIEWSISDTLQDARVHGRGRLHSTLPKTGRFDIVVWNRTAQTPRIIVEVKHPIYAAVANQLKDVKRICRALHRGTAKSTIKHGVFAFYSSSDDPKRKDQHASNRLKRRLAVIESEIARIASEEGCKTTFVCGRVHRVRAEAWSGCCAILNRT